ncbi:MAG: UDP-N-acetylglucosamine 2-epimerase (non-hydrolyzing) [Sphingomonas fennica]
MTERRRLLIVAGTRPEAIKLAPLVLAAARHPTLAIEAIATGQHPDLFHAAWAEFCLPAVHDLGLARPGQAAGALAAAVIRRLGPILAATRPDCLIVQGDTTSAWAAAMAARTAGVPVAHIEAGLRSGDVAEPWPEERNRIGIDRIAALLFAPTAAAAAALRAEQAGGAIHVTGNTGIDALFWMRRRLPAASPSPGRLLVATLHRRENIPHLPALCAALATIVAARPDVRLVVPTHPNPAVRDAVSAALSGVPRTILSPPLSYGEMVALLAGAYLLLTDSGGLQEEAPALGLPTLVLRERTERPEALATGNLRLVGTDPDAIATAALALLDDPATHAAMARPAFPYGDGHAAERIAALLATHPFAARRPRLEPAS